ncbi:hypothetical protein [Brevibacillus panacihumi]|uniref:Uncharacterized protein n=1 Tax=Brevibacillus panacihumi TaxID=497735 RepID=A0A3M8CSQ7_9BACL|nr:hypothetical protein [Brevibacillus panacihumi]RNB78431.1 hypothetical protein EDM58_11565 [Brevibacillus panacihumi]
MPLWVFLALVIGGILLFGAIYDLYTRRSKKRPPSLHTKYDQVYAEQLLQDTRDRVNDVKSW